MHDLDALRGFAMILGIVLHASLAFFPAWWVVKDSQMADSTWIDELEAAIHGFRMPLFFLLSGFFTTMLWRRRGLPALAEHRFRRIALPLLLGVITIVPLVDLAVGHAEKGSSDLVAAVAEGDAATVRRLVDVEAATATDERGGTLLHLAAYLGHLEVVEALLDAGADPSAPQDEPADPDGQTPVDVAVVGGHAAVAQVLVDRGGVDPRAPGEEWTTLWWFALAPPDPIVDSDVESGPGEPFTFVHLWFLWYLLLLVVGFLVVARLVEEVGERLPRWAAPAGMAALVPLAFLAHWFMVETWSDGLGKSFLLFGPFTATGLEPDLAILGYYGVFFTFGALAHGREAHDGTPVIRMLGRGWPLTLTGATVVFFVGLDATRADDPTVPWAVALQVVFTWSVIFGLLGLFRRLLRSERRGVRYLSDSSYWLYLAHLPLVIFLQSVIRDWEVDPTVKFVGLVVFSTAVLLVSYQLLVRYTPVGWLLNGRRTPTRMSLLWAPRQV